LTQRTTNTSHNAPLTGASLTVQVDDSSGTHLYTTTRNLAALALGQSVDTADLFLVSPSLSPGSYTAHSTVSAGGQTLATSQASFDIAYQAADEVVATLSAPSPFNIGSTLAVSATLTNNGALAVTGSTVEAQLLNIDTLAIES